MTESAIATTADIARDARTASAKLPSLTGTQRNQLLESFAAELEKQSSAILEANGMDCGDARVAVDRGEMSRALYDRLPMDAGKLASVIKGVRQVASLPDTIGELELARELDAGLNLYRVRCPIGVILIIFEARPDALPQIASLLIKSGNAGLLKGGKEAQKSNEAIFACLETALKNCNFPGGAYKLLPGRSQVAELLAMDKFIDLVIPRGSNELVRQIQESTRIPVLGHAEGICHLYVDEDADIDMAVKLAMDSKTNYPAACNSIETILVHQSAASTFLPKLMASAKTARLEVRMLPSESSAYGIAGTTAASEADWITEYSDLVVAVKVVASLEAAVEHINEHGSGHTECIVTANQQHFERFFAEVNSAGVFWNASTRFADGFRYGFGAEVGISTGKMHPRGPVGVDGITTYKYKLVGKGQLVADYVGANAKPFTHKNLPLENK